MRYERKFRITDLAVYDVIQLLRIHPLSIRELYPARRVNNIYYDTISMDTFHQNVEGLERRNKFRIRWYGNDWQRVISPQLEIKMKNGDLGDKKAFPLGDFDLSNLNEVNRTVNQITSNYHGLEPVLFNTYNRSYWQTANDIFRITVDTELQYRSVRNNGVSHIVESESAIIVEVKFDESHDDRLFSVADYLPFLLSKNSKYVNGVILTHRQ